MEGIVAGTPSLSQFDVDLDAGTSGAEDPDNAVSFDLSLPDGRTFSQTWQSFRRDRKYVVGNRTSVRIRGRCRLEWQRRDRNLAKTLPDANMLKAGADMLAQMANDLHTTAEAWMPTESDAFTALVVMVPTMSEYFASWRDSRFVSGNTSTQRDFNVIFAPCRYSGHP